MFIVTVLTTIKLFMLKKGAWIQGEKKNTKVENDDSEIDKV